MRFLIDECLTTALISIANLRGYDAQHIALIGKAGWGDWNVTRHAIDGDFILVTNNAVDFRKLYAVQPIHAGLVILLPNARRAVQKKLFANALAELVIIGEPINQVLEVGLDGEEMTFSLSDLYAQASS